jgi:hypothetical protein
MRLLLVALIVLTPLKAHESSDPICSAFSSDSCVKDAGAAFAGAAAWLLSKFHVSQMGIVLVFSSNRSLQRSLAPGMFPCVDRIVSPMDRKCFYFVEPRDLEQGLGGFDLLTGSPDSIFVVAAMIWDEDLLAVADTSLDELVSLLPRSTRVLLSKEVQMARAKEGAQLLEPFPRMLMEDATVESEPWAFYKAANTASGMHVQMRVTPAATQLSSADFVDGVCEARIDDGIDLSPMLCVAVWGYMYGEEALTECVDARSGRLEFSYTLPYGIVALGCAILEINVDDYSTRPAYTAKNLAAWFPGFGLRLGSNSVVRGYPLRTLGMASDSVYAMDGMKLSVAGSTVLDALRWSGFHHASYYAKVADQKHVISHYLRQYQSAEATVLEVGCGGLTVGSWLIDTLNAYSYACVDVAPWAPTLILKAGVRTDHMRPPTSSEDQEYSAFSVARHTNFGPKHAQIEGSSVCELNAANRGKMDLVFSLGALQCLSCNMLNTCLDNMVARLKPGGRMLITLPSSMLGTENVSFVRQPLAMHYPPFQPPCRASANATRRWAHSNGFVVSAIDLASLNTAVHQMSDVYATVQFLLFERT